MKIAVYGCGSMGAIIGAYISKKGYDVDMIDANQAHVDAMNKNGMKIVGFVNETIKVNAITPDQMTEMYELIILMTKQTANPVVLPLIGRHLKENGLVCTLQNGVPEPSVAEVIGKDKTVGGAIMWGATYISPGVSELTQDISKTDPLFEIGEIDGKITNRIGVVSEVLGSMGRAFVTDKLMDFRWGKLVNNACFSGMSAALGCTFGEVLLNAKACECACQIGKEVKACCDAEGYSLPPMLGKYDLDCLALESEEDKCAAKEVFKKFYSNAMDGKASMLQDLEKGLKTEVNMINGYVSKTGQKHGIPTPYNDKVVEIVRNIEDGKLELTMDNLELFKM